MFGLSTAEQDGRFSDKNAKLRSTLSFAPNISKPINFKLVNVDILTPWVTRRITELLGVEDEIVAETVMCTLREAKSNNSTLDAKALQITLTVFLNQGNAKTFMKELITLLLSAMESPGGVPRQLLDEKKEQMLQLAREKSQHAILKLSSMQQHPSPQHAAGIYPLASNIISSSTAPITTPGHNVDASTIEALREKLNQKKIAIEKSLTQKAALKAAAVATVRERESSLKTTPSTPLATISTHVTPSLGPSPALSEDTKVPIQLLRRQFEAKVGIETRISLIKQKIAELDASQNSTSAVPVSEDVVAQLTRLREAHIQLQEKLETQSAEIILTIGGKEEVQKAYDEMVALTRSGKSVATALVSMAAAEKALSSKDTSEEKGQNEERHRARERERGSDRRERSRDDYHSRRRDHSRNRSKSRDRESYRDYDRGRSSRDYRGRDRDRDGDRSYDRDRERERDRDRDRERSHREYRERDRERDREREKRRNHSRSRSPSRPKVSHKSRRSPSPSTDRREK